MMPDPGWLLVSKYSRVVANPRGVRSPSWTSRAVGWMMKRPAVNNLKKKIFNFLDSTLLQDPAVREVKNLKKQIDILGRDHISVMNMLDRLSDKIDQLQEKEEEEEAAPYVFYAPNVSMSTPSDPDITIKNISMNFESLSPSPLEPSPEPSGQSTPSPDDGLSVDISRFQNLGSEEDE